MGKLVKVCGMRDADNIREVESLGVDMMGFIFFDKSPRNVTSVPSYLPVSAARVGVFVGSSDSFILSTVDRFGLSHVQLHGSESPEQCSFLRDAGLKVIKAFSIAGPEDMGHVSDYADCCDMFLFDTKCPGAGGSGRRFDWSLMDAYRGPVPFLLSGGIGPDALEQLMSFGHPYLAGYDLNSRFELAPALKDTAAIRDFLIRLKEN